MVILNFHCKLGVDFLFCLTSCMEQCVLLMLQSQNGKLCDLVTYSMHVLLNGSAFTTF